MTNAGAVFLGEQTSSVLGDYAVGTNHVLPTGGLARAAGGLGLEAFLKPIQFVRATREGVAAAARDRRAAGARRRAAAHARGGRGGAAVTPAAVRGFPPYAGLRAVRVDAAVPAAETLRFDQNVPPLPGVPQVPIGESFARLNEYPDGDYARAARGGRRATRVSLPEQIVVGAGADDLILLVARTFLSARPDRDRADARPTRSTRSRPRSRAPRLDRRATATSSGSATRTTRPASSSPPEADRRARPSRPDALVVVDEAYCRIRAGRQRRAAARAEHGRDPDASPRRSGSPRCASATRRLRRDRGRARGTARAGADLRPGGADRHGGAARAAARRRADRRRARASARRRCSRRASIAPSRTATSSSCVGAVRRRRVSSCGSSPTASG